jgi:hypothetical protein
MRNHTKHIVNGLIGVTAVLFVGTRFTPEHDTNGPVLTAAVNMVNAGTVKTDSVKVEAAPTGLAAKVTVALGAFATVKPNLSHPRALEDAFKSYFAYKAQHPQDVKKPYLYFVDYGLSNTTPRGYVFDMDKLTIVDGPFMVAHGRGSSKGEGVPTRFSNAHGSASTSLGLYLAQETYNFGGHSAGRYYTSIGLRLKGLSKGFNDNARGRGVVAHGAPYVTKTRAGRSEGCPAVEQSRAKQLLPKLANGAMVFLFAPNESWMAGDQWVGADVG